MHNVLIIGELMKHTVKDSRAEGGWHILWIFYTLSGESPRIHLSQYECLHSFLNQAHAGRRPACAWFLEITFVPPKYVCVCLCVCVHPRGHK